MKKLKLSIIGFSVLAGSLTLGFAGSSGWSSNCPSSRATCPRGECGSRAMMQYSGRMMMDDSSMMGDRSMEDRDMYSQGDRPMHDRMMHNRSMDDRGMRDSSMHHSSGRMMDDSAWQGMTGTSAGYSSGSASSMNPGLSEVDEEIVEVDME